VQCHNPAMRSLLLTVAACLHLAGQTEPGRIVGRVVDPQKADISGATIVLARAGQPTEVAKALTGPDGSFVLPGVAPGAYLVSAEATGFARTVKSVKVKGGADTNAGNLVLKVDLSKADCILTLTSPPNAPASVPFSLHLIRKIHIGNLDGDPPGREPLVRQRLKTELEAAGFQTVDDPSAADAVLSAQVSAWITLDGDESDQTGPRDSYRFQLTPPAAREPIWKAKIYVSGGQRVENEALQVARDAAKKLSAARRKAARKSGLK